MTDQFAELDNYNPDPFSELDNYDPTPKPAGLGTRAVNTAQALGRLAYDTPGNLASYAANLNEGSRPLDKTNWADQATADATKRLNERTSAPDANDPTLLGTKSDWAQTGASVPFSVGSMGAALGAGGLTTAITKNPFAGYAAGAGAAGSLAYRADTSMFMNSAIDAFTTDYQNKNNGQAPSRDALLAEQERLQPYAQDHGLWEALPEAAGSVVGGKIVSSVFKGTGNLAWKAGKIAAGLTLEELPTETITQHGQHNTEIDAGIAAGEKRSFTSPSDVSTSFGEVVTPVLQQSLLMGGGGSAVKAAYDYAAARKQKLEQTASTGPLGGALANGGFTNEGDHLADSNLDLRTDEQKAQDNASVIDSTAVNTNQSPTLHSSSYDNLFQQAESNYGLPAGLLSTMGFHESGFNPNTVSPVGARGVMQFMPATAQEYGIDPHDTPAAIDAAGKKMAGLVKYYNGDMAKAVAAYNYGEGNLNNTIAKAGDNWQSALPPETQDYLSRILGGQQSTSANNNTNTQSEATQLDPSLNALVADDQLQGTPNPDNVINNPADAAYSPQPENLNGSQKADESTNETSAQEKGSLLSPDALEQSGASSLIDNAPHDPLVSVIDRNTGTAFHVLQSDLDSNKDRLTKHSVTTGKRLLTPILRQDIVDEQTYQQELADQQQRQDEQANQQTETQAQDQTGADQSTAVTAPLLNKRTNQPFTTQKLAEAAIASSSNPTLNKQDHIAIPVDGGFGIVPKPNTTQGNNDTTTKTQSVLSNTLADATGVTASAPNDVAGQASNATAQEVKQPWEITQAEHLDNMNKGRDPEKNKDAGYIGTVNRLHKSHIVKALSEGKSVPQEVLADYPDLQAPVQETANTIHDTADVSKKGENGDTAKADSFVTAPDGSKDFGEITPEQAEKIGNLPGKIRLQHGIHDDVTGGGYGKVHIDRELRQDQLKDNGYQSTEELVNDVAKNHNAIYQGKGDSYILAKLNGKAKIAFVQVKKGEDGSFYSIGSGLVSREDYLKNKPLLWERAQTNQLKESPSAVTGQSNDQVKSIAQSPENAIAEKLTTKVIVLAVKATSNIQETDKATALFSKASVLSDDAKPAGITESQANAAIATFKRDFGNIDGVKFKVYKTLSDAVGETEAKKIGRVKGFYLPNSKTIAIIRDALHHVQDAAETLRHETLGHFGLNLLRPADKLAFLGDIARSKNNLFLREMFAEVVRNYPELANDEFMQAEEVFAKVAEDQPSELTQWLDKQLLKLLGLFRKIGFLKGYVTKTDMRDMAKSLAEGIRRGDSQKTFPKNNHSQFSKSAIPKLKVNLSDVTESGGHFATGVPVTFKYVHNTASYTALLGKKGKPPIDSPYGRGYEPSGQFLTVVGRHPAERRSEMEYGEVTFNNPLVIDNDSLNWKKQLSDSFGGKTGKYLSEAVIKAGYDGIVTTENGHTSEVVNLTNFDKSIAKYSKSTTPVVNPHSKTSLNQAVTKAMDSLFGQGWTNRLMATGKFKVISRDEAVQIAGSTAANAKGFFNSDTDITYLVYDNIEQDASSKALVGLMLHEISTHSLNLGKSSEAFQDILRRFEALKATNPKVQAAFANVPASTPDEHKVEEALAEYLAENPKSSLAQRLIEWFRQAVRALGKTLPVLERAKFSQWANKLTEAELIGMATSALKSAPDSLQFDNVGRNREGIKFSNKDVKNSLIENADPIREVPISREQWDKDFPSNKVTTPIGEFKLGENQFNKINKDDRRSYMGLIKPTLENPTYIVKNKRGAIIFIKAFTKPDGGIKGFMSVSYNIDGLDIVISNHPKEILHLTKEINSGELIKEPRPVERGTTIPSTTQLSHAGGLDETITQQDDNSSNNNIKFSRSTPSNTPADNSAMRSFFAKAQGKQALGWLAGLFQRNHLIDFVAQDLPELINYKLLSQEKDNFTNQRENEIGKSYKEMLDKLDKKTMHELGRVQGMATRLVKFDPALADNNTPMTEEELAAYDAYTAMPDSAKEAYATMRKDYQDDLTEKNAALKERIKAFPADKETQAKIISTIQKHFDQFKEGVYFPLNRDGAVIVKATNADGELVIEHVATQADAYKLVKEMTAQGYDNTHIIGKDAYDRDLLAGNAANEMAALAHKTISDLKEKSVQGKLTESDFNDLFSEFNQLLINTLPDSSYRKHFIHRKGTLGESTDTLRAYAKTRTSAVKMIASLTYDHQIQDVLNNADKTIKEMDKVAGSDTLAIKSIVNELKLREAALKSTEINAVSQVLTSLGFMGALGFNIGSAAVNMLQVVGVALPELIGRHGEVEAMKEIASAYKLLFNPANLDKASGLDITKNPHLSAIATQAMKNLASIGKIDLTMTHDSIAAGKNPSYSSNPATRAFGAATKYSGYFFHVAEAANRQITGMAAFNLAYKKNGGNFEAAIAEAVDVIDRTQFDYGQGNRARYMMSNTARVLTLFKAYALGMSYFIGRNAMLSMKGETPEVRRQARKTLVASMAMSFATAGLFGMPIGIEAFAGIGGVAAFKYKGAKFAVPGAIGGMLIFQALLAGLGADDEDELETEFRNWLTDNFDQTTAEFVTKGPARLLPIGDIAGRTSLSELWWRSQNKQLEGTDQYNAIATALIGPIGSQVAGLFTAKKMYEDGQYSRMVESMSPAFLRNAIAANRMGSEGVTNLKGDKIIQRDLTPVELINKVIGFNPTVVTNTYDANSAIAKESTKHTIGKSHLTNRWISGDATERSDLMKGAIKDFNESVPPSERITLKSLFKSMRSRKGIDKHTKNGLYLSKKQNYLRDIGRFNQQE